MSRGAARARDERGSASVVVAAVVLVALVLALGVADVGRATVARTRARWAADAAALAAAQDLAMASATTDPAASADALASANGAELVACVCAPGTAEAIVEVRLRLDGLFLVPGERWVSARARAVVGLSPPAA